MLFFEAVAQNKNSKRIEDICNIWPDFKNLFLLAVQKGHLEVVRGLIESGADLMAKYDNGKTALIYELEKGHTEIAKLLVNKEADISTLSHIGQILFPIFYSKSWKEIAQDPKLQESEFIKHRNQIKNIIKNSPVSIGSLATALFVSTLFSLPILLPVAVITLASLIIANMVGVKTQQELQETPLNHPNLTASSEIDSSYRGIGSYIYSNHNSHDKGPSI